MRRLVLIVLFAVAASARPAGAVSVPVVYTGGDDILHVKDITVGEAVDLGYGFTQIGYHYHRTGLWFLDLWRWDGEFVIYSGPIYLRLDPSEVAALGLSVPWRYHCPPGLLVVVGLIELAVISRTRRRANITIGIGCGLLGVAGVFYVAGLDIEFAVPLLLGLHHIVGTVVALRAHAHHDDDAHELGLSAPEPEPRPERRADILPSPPMVETDPFRAPPRTPIAAVQPTRARTDAPIVHDPNAEQPKLLG